MHYFKSHELDVICMQETHCTKKVVNMWQKEWGSKWYLSEGTSASRGTVIMLRPNSGLTVNNVLYDNEGRQVIMQVSKDNVQYVIVNRYAPNADSPEFFKKLMKRIENYRRRFQFNIEQ